MNHISFELVSKPNQPRRRANGYWTLERCKIDAARFSSRGEWSKNSPSAYMAAYRNKWLNECCPSKERRYWTFERCKADAARFSSRVEWWKNSAAAYSAAVKNGWLDQCCSHMVRLDKKTAVFEGVEYESLNALLIAIGFCSTKQEASNASSNIIKNIKLHNLTQEEAIKRLIKAPKRGSRLEQASRKKQSDDARRKRVVADYSAWWSQSFFTPVVPCKCCGIIMRGGQYPICSDVCRTELKRKADRKQRVKQRQQGKRDNKHYKRARRYSVDYVYGLTWKAVAQQRGMKCMVCGIKCSVPNGQRVTKEATLGHIVALANGGSHTWDNVQIECRLCNETKGIKTYGQLVML